MTEEQKTEAHSISQPIPPEGPSNNESEIIKIEIAQTDEERKRKFPIEHIIFFFIQSCFNWRFWNR